MNTSKQDIKRLGTILGVWAHPDDETMSSAGIMLSAIKNGQRVICLTATKGEEGSQDEKKWPKSKLASIREKELTASLKVIGVKEHHWLGFKDGNCRTEDNKGVEIVCKFILKYLPDTILTFGPDGFTGHSDHKAVSAWVTKAVLLTGSSARVYHSAITKEHYLDGLNKLDEKLNIFFELSQPNFIIESEKALIFKLSPKLQEAKYRALKVIPSQTEVMLKAFSKSFICKTLSVEIFAKSK